MVNYNFLKPATINTVDALILYLFIRVFKLLNTNKSKTKKYHFTN